MLKRGKSKKQVGGSKCPFPFHWFPVVWERCYINQSLDSFHLRDQQSLSPTWSRIRWQFVKKVRTLHCGGLCNFDSSYDFSSIWPACNLCATIAIFPRNCHYDFWSLQSIFVTSFLKYFYLKLCCCQTYINATAVWSDQVIPEYSIPLCLYCWHPSGGGPGMREGEGGIGCIIQKGRGEGCQLLLHVGHSIHRATTVTTIIFVTQEGKCFWPFVSQT